MVRTRGQPGKSPASGATAKVKKTITKSKSRGAAAGATPKPSKKSTTLHRFTTVKKPSSSSEATKATKKKEIVIESSLGEINENDKNDDDGSGADDKSSNEDRGLAHSNGSPSEVTSTRITTTTTTTTKERKFKRTRQETEDDDKEQCAEQDEDSNIALPLTPKRKKLKSATGQPKPSPQQPQQLLSPPPSSPSQGAAAAALPTVLANYISIHSNLLTHLLLHYSRKSINTPEIVSNLIPNLARSSHRNVSLEDLRRISSLSEGTINVVHTEQGTGIELVGEGVLAKIDSLRSGFGGRVRNWWEENKAGVASVEKDDIVCAMELAPICEAKASKGNVSAKSVKKTLLAKGQQRLSELKKFSVLKPANGATTTTTASTTTTAAALTITDLGLKKENAPLTTTKPVAAAARGSSLLERIRAKQAKAAAAPPPPPKEFLQKQSALQSLENIIPILLQLTASAKKTGGKLATSITSSFPLQVVITHIQNSAKNPISAQDAERAIRVLAADVAPSWCRVVEWQATGKSEGKTPTAVVFDRRGKESVEKWKWKDQK